MKKIEQIIQDKFYTGEEAGEFLEVSTQTVTRYCRKGGLKGKQMGPRKKWHVQGVEIIKKIKDWNMVEK